MTRPHTYPFTIHNITMQRILGHDATYLKLVFLCRGLRNNGRTVSCQSINQSIYFGGNTLTIMFNQFQLFSFFLDHWFLLGSWCSLAHREPKWLRNLFPGANFVYCYLGLFCGHIDGKEYSEYTAMRSSSGKVRIWKNWPTTGRDGDRAKHTF